MKNAIVLTTFVLLAAMILAGCATTQTSQQSTQTNVTTTAVSPTATSAATPSEPTATRIGPAGSTPANPTPTASGAGIALVGEAVSYKWDALGDNLVVVGLLRNDASDVESGEVAVTFYGADGKVVGTRSDFIPALNPGDRWAFNAPTYSSVSVPASQIASYKVRVSSEPSFLKALPPGSVEVSADSMTRAGPNAYWPGHAIVAGELTNRGTSTLTFPSIAIAIFDGSGKLVDVLPAYAQPSDVPPGGGASFQGEGDRTEGDFASYEVYVAS